jgi:hypothetical protein
MKSHLLRSLSIGITLAIVSSLCFAVIANATFLPVPLYPPGPPYSRSGNGGQGPNMWSASGQGNPEFGRLGNIYWWQTLAQITEDK